MTATVLQILERTWILTSVIACREAIRQGQLFEVILPVKFAVKVKNAASCYSVEK